LFAKYRNQCAPYEQKDLMAFLSRLDYSSRRHFLWEAFYLFLGEQQHIDGHRSPISECMDRVANFLTRTKFDMSSFYPIDQADFLCEKFYFHHRIAPYLFEIFVDNTNNNVREIIWEYCYVDVITFVYSLNRQQQVILLKSAIHYTKSFDQRFKPKKNQLDAKKDVKKTKEKEKEKEIRSFLSDNEEPSVEDPAELASLKDPAELAFKEDAVFFQQIFREQEQEQEQEQEEQEQEPKKPIRELFIRLILK
jgi:hypothetical protein